jgi:hypothetical protein
VKPDEILAAVRANLARLASCSLHDFHGVPEGAMPCKDGFVYRDYRCSKCGGKISSSDHRWYVRGLEHGGATVKPCQSPSSTCRFFDASSVPGAGFCEHWQSCVKLDGSDYCSRREEKS